MKRKITTYGGYFERFISTLSTKELLKLNYRNQKIECLSNSSNLYVMDYMSYVWNIIVIFTEYFLFLMMDK